MQGGNINFDIAKQVLHVDAHIVADHPQTVPAVDAAIAELKRSGRPVVKFEKQADGHWNVKIILAPAMHHNELAKQAFEEDKKRKEKHAAALADQDAQQVKAAAEAKAKERKEAGLPPESDVDELPDEVSKANPNFKTPPTIQ